MGRLFNATEKATVGGQIYKLAIDIEIIDEIEDDVGCGFLDLMAEIGGEAKGRKGAARGGMRIGKMSKVVRGLLLRYHPGITLNEAGSLFLEHGDEIGVALENLFAKAWPDQAETKGAPPRKARRGTGASSLSNGAQKTSRRAISGDKPHAPSP